MTCRKLEMLVFLFFFFLAPRRKFLGNRLGHSLKLSRGIAWSLLLSIGESDDFGGFFFGYPTYFILLQYNFYIFPVKEEGLELQGET